MQKQLIFYLIGIFFIAVFFNLYNNNFSLSYHSDEPIKVSEIRSGVLNFRHPLLMIQLTKLTNSFFALEELQDIAVLGRSIVAFFGALIPLLTFLIVRKLLNQKYALVAAIATATSPLLVVHSHYLKEDIFLTFFSLLSIILFFIFVEKQRKSMLISFGVSLGLAISSKYSGFLLFILFLATLLFISFLRTRKYFLNLSAAFGIALGVFLIVNYPIFFQFNYFKEGILFETEHIFEGHIPKISATSRFFLFHLTKSIIPGISFFVAFLALVGVGLAFVKWPKITWHEKFLITYLFLFYIAHEISPLKPFPDFSRYMLPIVPILIFFACKSVYFIENSVGKEKRGVIFFCFIVILSIPAIQSVMLDRYLNDDTREIAQKYIASTGKKATSELYGLFSYQTRFLPELDIVKEQKENVTYWVASSFSYDRFYVKNNDPYSKEMRAKYEELFNSFPYFEIKPRYKSFAFSNPTIRIINIKNSQH